MILKEPDDKSALIADLQDLLRRADATTAREIKKTLAILRAGIKGEKESAYHINFHFADKKNTVVIHDLRLEHNGRVAQIDHLLINRAMEFFILETKHFSSGLKIEKDGQFLRWNDWQKRYDGMASPIEQGERQGIVLKDLASSLDWPTRAGFRLTPAVTVRVLVSPEARIINESKDKKIAESVVKADLFANAYFKRIEAESVLSSLALMARAVSADTIWEVGQALLRCHQPAKPNHAAKVGLAVESTQLTRHKRAAGDMEAHKCKHCGSSALEMTYGRYGYYFKCQSCDKNTPPPRGCHKNECRSRIRKSGAQFIQHCQACDLERLVHVNTS